MLGNRARLQPDAVCAAPAAGDQHGVVFAGGGPADWLRLEEGGEEVDVDDAGVTTFAFLGVLVGLVLVPVALVMRTRKRSVFNA